MWCHLLGCQVFDLRVMPLLDTVFAPLERVTCIEPMTFILDITQLDVCILNDRLVVTCHGSWEKIHPQLQTFAMYMVPEPFQTSKPTENSLVLCDPSILIATCRRPSRVYTTDVIITWLGSYEITLLGEVIGIEVEASWSVHFLVVGLQAEAVPATRVAIC